MRATTTMAPAGVNRKTAPQFLDPRSALSMINYEIEDEGKLFKRLGISEAFTVAGGVPVTMLRKWTDDVVIFGYGTTIARYLFSTDTVTTIKNDFSANTGFDGTKYGEYFFVCNGVEKIWRIDLATFTPTEVAASPICSVLKAIGNRLYAGNLSTDSTAVIYSEVDDGSNPPFDGWPVGTDLDEAGTVYYRNAATVRSICAIGPNVVVFSDDGFFSFNIGSLDSAGVLTKIDNIVKYQEDFGGARGAVETAQGIFYANEGGLWQLVADGQQDIPYSKQEILTSINLGRNFFDDVDFSNTDLVFSQRKNTVYVTAAKDSDVNNYVLVYNLNYKAFTTFSGWNISRWMNIGADIYGASAGATTMYKCFDGFNDNGNLIFTDYLQELKLGDLQTRQMLKGCYVQGLLSPSSEILVKFDIYDVQGLLINNKLRFSWTAENVGGQLESYNSASYSGSVYGGDADLSGMVESFDGCRPFIRNFQRVRLHMTSADQVPHVLTWVSLDSRIKTNIRRRKMTLLTS